MQNKTLIVDNYDSFTYNLVQLVAEVTGTRPLVIKNDELSFSEISNLNPSNIIISPGPGHPKNPEDFGVCADLIAKSNLPILGVCLGHQGIAQAYGGEIICAPQPMHGLNSWIKHFNDPLFLNIPSTFSVTRYHSLLVNLDTIPSCLRVIAKTSDNLIMALRHVEKPQWGVQFHPESIASTFGKQLMANFLGVNAKTNFQTRAKPLTASNYNYSLTYEILDDFYSAEHVFSTIYAKSSNCVWLDSNSNPDENGRFSILADDSGPNSFAVRYNCSTRMVSINSSGQISTLSMSIFEFLQQKISSISIQDNVDLPCNFKCGFIGYLGYELYQETLDIQCPNASPYPDAQFLFVDRAIVIDNLERKLYLLSLTPKKSIHCDTEWFNFVKSMLKLYQPVLKSEPPKLNLKLLKDRSHYLHCIAKCQQHIFNGESYEICLTNKATSNQVIDPKKRSCKNLSPLELKRCILGLLSVKSKSTQLLLYR